MIFNNKSINLILLLSICFLAGVCVYIGYKNIYEPFSTESITSMNKMENNSMINTTIPNTTSFNTLPLPAFLRDGSKDIVLNSKMSMNSNNSNEPFVVGNISTQPNTSTTMISGGNTTTTRMNPTTTMMSGGGTTTTMMGGGATGSSITGGATSSTIMGVGNTTTRANTTIPATTLSMTMTTTPKLMDNGYKIPHTNLYQSQFTGTSNVYSPYLYMKEPFQPISYDMDNYTHI
jgi:hypothetical protein